MAGATCSIAPAARTSSSRSPPSTPRSTRWRAHEPAARGLSDAALTARAQAVRAARAGRPRAETRAELFALAREAARRALGQRPYDEQIVAALALDRGAVVEMHTGEGKTLTATMPVALHALDGRGAHVLTFNDYLARRDAEWMGPIYRLLGLSVGVVQQGDGRRSAAARLRRRRHLRDREGSGVRPPA